MTPEVNPETPAKARKKRDQLDYVQFDCDFFDKPKIQAVMYLGGCEAVCFLMRLYMALGRSTNAEMSKLHARGVAYSLRIDDELADKILEHCIVEGMLLSRVEDGVEIISAQRIIEDQENIAEKRDIWREKERRKKGGLPGVLSGDTPESTRETLNTEYMNTEDLNIKKKKDRPPKVAAPPVVVPHPMAAPPEPLAEPPAVADLPPDADDFLISAENSLEKPGRQPWVNQNPFMVSGRRPMNNFPMIRVTRTGLAEALRQHEKAGLDLDDSREIFRAIEAKLRHDQGMGKNPDLSNCELWAMGWAMKEQLEKKTQANRLKRSSDILNGEAKYAR